MHASSFNHKPKLTIRRAGEADLPDIMRIECASFPTPWSEWALRAEISDTRRHLYLVVARGAKVLSYIGGQWFPDTYHISTLAVDETVRRRGLGEGILLALLLHLAENGTRYATLEYRVRNRAADCLYEKLGFTQVCIRMGYYRDTNEDAVEVAMDDLDEVARQHELRQLWQQWHDRYGYDVEIIL